MPLQSRDYLRLLLEKIVKSRAQINTMCRSMPISLLLSFMFRGMNLISGSSSASPFLSATHTRFYMFKPSVASSIVWFGMLVKSVKKNLMVELATQTELEQDFFGLCVILCTGLRNDGK